MKNLLVIIGLSLLSQTCFGQQFKRIPVDLIYKQHVSKFLIKQDSIVKEYDRPMLEVETLAIKITDVFFSDVMKDGFLIIDFYLFKTFHDMTGDL